MCFKILHITKHYPPHKGGIESVTFDIVEGVHQRGHMVDVLCCNEKNLTEIDYFDTYKVTRASRLAKKFSTSLSLSLILKLYTIRNDYQLIHLHLPDPMSVFAMFLVRPKGKLVIHWHSDIIKQKKLLKVFLPLQNWILKRADKIIGTSPIYIAESEQLRRFIYKCVSVPIGIQESRITVNMDIAAKFLKDYPGKKLIFSLGRLVYYKGFQYLIEAAKLLPDEAIVLIGGDGELREDLKNKIRLANLESKIILLGRISDEVVYSVMSISSIFCFPSTEKSEAFGVVQLEAMALGVPIVATDIIGSGVPWVNKHRLSGINVRTKDPIALAGAINELLHNLDVAKRLGANGRKRFETMFTQKSMVDSILKLYRKVLCDDCVEKN